MLENYLKTSFRFLKRSKIYSAINIIGLSIALAVVMDIFLWAQNELSFDKYNLNASRIYRVITRVQSGQNSYTLPLSAAPLAQALKQLTQIENVVRLSRPMEDIVFRSGNVELNENNFFYADPTFFDVFTIHMLRGDPRTALLNPYSIVLSESLAEQLFPQRDPVGNVVSIITSNQKHEYLITGVMQDTPQASHFHINALASFATLEANDKAISTRWKQLSYYTYFLLAQGNSVSSVSQQLPGIISRNMGESYSNTWSLSVQRITNIHLHSHLLLEIEPNSSVELVIIFIAVGFLVLLVAVINFISISTARYSDRAKEVGIRKTVGATKKDLIIQFMTEAVLTVLVSGLIGLFLIEISLPQFCALTGKSLSLSVMDVVTMFAAIIVIGAIAGTYPAFFLSSFQTGLILRKDILSITSGSFLRKILIVMQFSVAVGIMVTAFIVTKQMNYVQEKDLGFTKNNIVVIPLRHEDLQKSYSLLRDKFLEVPNVEGVSGASGELGNTNFVSSMSEGDKELFEIRFLAVDYNYLDVMGIQLLSGRSFSRDHASDSNDAIIVNEVAAQKLKSLKLLDAALNPNIDVSNHKESHVIGVVRDFNYQSLYNPIEPFVMYLDPSQVRYMVVRIAKNDVSHTLKDLGMIWKQTVSDYPFEYQFLDEVLEGQYQSDERISSVFAISSFLAIFISALGLLGMANYTVEKRTKEIGIRKVLGASASSITFLLMKDFVKLVLLANLIAWPMAFYVSETWLRNFSYRISPNASAFAFAAIISLVVAIFTISFRSMKAAAANPVDTMRYE